MKVGKLSGGQRTQVALVMALAKRPSLLLLDEPLSDLDPVARREVMGTLMVDLAERNVTVVLSSHSLVDLTRACDWLVLVDAGRVRLADSIDALLAGHQLLIGPVADATASPGGRPPSSRTAAIVRRSCSSEDTIRPSTSIRAGPCGSQLSRIWCSPISSKRVP